MLTRSLAVHPSIRNEVPHGIILTERFFEIRRGLRTTAHRGGSNALKLFPFSSPSGGMKRFIRICIRIPSWTLEDGRRAGFTSWAHLIPACSKMQKQGSAGENHGGISACPFRLFIPGLGRASRSSPARRVPVGR